MLIVLRGCNLFTITPICPALGNPCSRNHTKSHVIDHSLGLILSIGLGQNDERWVACEPFIPMAHTMSGPPRIRVLRDSATETVYPDCVHH